MFEGSRLKVERADQHIRELMRMQSDFFAEPRPYEQFIEIDADNRYKSHKIRPTKQPPLMMAIICGEVLYLLRSALDQLMTRACTRNGFEGISHTGFPTPAFPSKTVGRNLNALFEREK
jgi:hypothetical protein